MKKKIKFFTVVRSIAIVAAFGLLIAACSGGGGRVAKETDFRYELNSAGDGIVITGYQKDAAGGEVIIPDTIEGYPVVAIRSIEYGFIFSEGGNYWDLDARPRRLLTDAEVKAKGLRPYITSIVFPDSVTEISVAEGAQGIISACGTLKSITLPKNLKELPRQFTSECSNLTAIKWPENLEIIGTQAFSFAGFTEVVIPEGVKEIRDYAFFRCESLTSVTISGSIERIGRLAFAGNPDLTNVTIPSKTIQYGSYNPQSYSAGANGWVPEQDNNAFANNPKLTSIAVRKAITDTGYKGSF